MRSAPTAPLLHAKPGDTLIIDDAGPGRIPRIGIIIAVANQDGTPPYLVSWTGGDYQSRIVPGIGARIEKRQSPWHMAAGQATEDEENRS